LSTLIPLAEIDTSDRLRSISEDHAQVLAASMREQGGLIHAIEVAPIKGRGRFKYKLTAGGHRYRAAEILGWTEIKAEVVAVDPTNRRLREIDENLIRRELTALDRARFLAERKRIYEQLNPGARHGGDRRSDQAANLATWSFAADVAEKTGLSERTVRRACELAAKLSPEVVDRVAFSELADNQAALEALAKQPPERQLAVIKLMFREEDPARSVADALARLDGKSAKAPSEGGLLAKFVDLWGRMGAKDRRGVLAYLAEADLPKGWSVTVRAGVSDE